MSKSNLIHLEDMDLATVLMKGEESYKKYSSISHSEQVKTAFLFGALQASYEQLYQYATTGKIRATPPLNPI